MKITAIKIRKFFNNERPLKAILSVTFDDQLAVHDVKIVYAGDRHIVVMPGKKMPDGSFRDITHPINREFRAELEEEILAAYKDALASGLTLVDGDGTSEEF